MLSALLLDLSPGAGQSWPGRTTSPTRAQTCRSGWWGEAQPNSSLGGCFLDALPPWGGGDQRPGALGSSRPCSAVGKERDWKDTGSSRRLLVVLMALHRGSTDRALCSLVQSLPSRCPPTHTHLGQGILGQIACHQICTELGKFGGYRQ